MEQSNKSANQSQSCVSGGVSGDDFYLRKAPPSTLPPPPKRADCTAPYIYASPPFFTAYSVSIIKMPKGDKSVLGRALVKHHNQMIRETKEKGKLYRSHHNKVLESVTEVSDIEAVIEQADDAHRSTPLSIPPNFPSICQMPFYFSFFLLFLAI